MLNPKVMLLVKKSLSRVEKDLYTSFSSELAVVNELVEGFIKSGGKRIRPAFHILTSAMCGYTGDYVRHISVILEYVHTSSLLHDDVIDGASVRRGRPSANSIYGNNITVLAGDYLYTSAFLSIIKLPGKDYANVLTNAVASMSEGEILQLQKTGDLTLTMEEYKKIIYGKTAALFSAACECGAISGEQSPELRAELREYGCNAGYAFQMKDDLLDYFGERDVLGKMPGTDMDEGKVTLPVILLLRELSQDERVKFCDLFASELPHDEKLAKILAVFNKHDIHKKASNVVQSYVEAALGNIAHFPESPYKDALVELTQELNYRVS